MSSLLQADEGEFGFYHWRKVQRDWSSPLAGKECSYCLSFSDFWET
ncbi:MAG: hypothetical protein NZ805_03180 [Armatimonadetes bacterium]|nr:hypothetical protein [Armatimonadota bacterium]MDW8029054.1 hypothetical protein [Armatimonadota bacterium]